MASLKSFQFSKKTKVIPSYAHNTTTTSKFIMKQSIPPSTAGSEVKTQA